jgi:hypothetical protein
MSAWIVIAATDLNDYLVGAQVNALRTAALAAGQADPFNAVMPAVAARVRAEVQGCKTNQISATANSVPPDLKRETVLLILEAMQTRLPSLKLTEDQRSQIDRAYDYLKRIARCEVPISQPDDPLSPSNVQKGGDAELVTKTDRVATRAKLDGL